MKATRVLHVIVTMNPAHGGVCQALRTAIRGLATLGIISEVVSLDAPGDDFLRNDTFKTYALGNRLSPWAFNSNLLAWLRGNISNYEVVIVHGLWQYQTYAVHISFKEIKAIKPKLFVMPHGMLDPYFQRAKGRKIKAARNWVFWKFFESNLIRSADGILFTCETERLLAKETFSGYQPKSEHIVGLGVDPPPTASLKMIEAFERHTGLNSTQRFWLFISRIHSKKGVDLLVSSYLTVKSKVGKLPKLVIAGPGLETTYGQEILSKASSDQDIIFTGMIDGNVKWGAFYGCEAFLLPSHQENFGIAVVEALACSKPVVISNQVNIWREIYQEGGGLICDDNQQGVDVCISRLYEMTETGKETMGKQARATYEKYFTVEQAALNLRAAIT